MKTNEIIEGLRKLCGQGTEYRRNVCRLAADTLESQQKRIAELEAELRDERYRHDRYVDFELAEAAELARVRAERRWIPVTERLPESDLRVLVSCCTKKGVQSVNMAYYWNRAWHGQGSMAGVTHWMPLPEPPKEE